MSVLMASVSNPESIALESYLGFVLIILVRRLHSQWEAETWALIADEIVELPARLARIGTCSGALVCRTLWFQSISR